MIKIKYILNVLLLIVSIYLSNYAQQRYKSERKADIIEYTVKEGLPITTISKITQTDDGYIWISGLEGTVRFNGYDFEEVGKEIGLSSMQFHYYDAESNTMYFASPSNFIKFQNEKYKVYSETDGYRTTGLPGRYTTFIKKDSKGVVWIGSATLFVDAENNGGLTSFDGNKFTVYDSTSFPLHNAINMFETPYGELLFASEGKNTRSQDESYMALFKNREFTRIDEELGVSLQGGIFGGAKVLSTFTEPVVDSEGNTWISFSGNGDLFSVNKKTTGVLMYDGVKFHQFPGIEQYLVGVMRVSSVFYLNENKSIYASLSTWSGESYSSGMNLLVKFKNDRWEKVDFYNEAGPLYNLETGLMINDYRFTYSKFIPKTHTFPDLLVIGSVQETAIGAKFDQYFYYDNGWKKYDAVTGFPAGAINDAAIISTTRGFSFYHPNKSILISKKDGLLNINNVVPSMYSDRTGLVWITHSSVELPSIIQVNDEGINVWDGSRLITLTKKDGLSDNLVYSINEDKKGRIWAATQKGLSMCRVIRNSQDEWVIKAKHINSSKGDPYSVSQIIELSDGSIYSWQNYVRPADGDIPKAETYFAKFDGDRLIEFDSPVEAGILDARKYQFFFLRELQQGGLLLEATLADENKDLASNVTQLFTYDGESWAKAPESWQIPEKHLKYVGTIKNKMYYLSPGHFYSFDSNNFIDLSDTVTPTADFRILKEASSAGTITNIQAGNYLYIRVRLKGLAIFDGTNLNFYTTKNGLPTANIFNPMVDKKGNVYFAHQFGGMVINGEQFNIYFNEDINEGRESAISMDINGDFAVFYTGLGLHIDREKGQNNNVDISSVSVNDTKYFHDIPSEFDYDNNSFLFNYTSLNYIRSDETNYQHKLEGYDLDWSRLSNLQFTEYQNLPHGEYTFKVRIAEGISDYTEEASYSFTIDPPLWKTWYAYLLYLLIFASFMLGVRKYEKEKLERREKLRVEKEKVKAQVMEAEFRAETAELQAKAAEAQAKVIQSENDRKSIELEEARNLQLSMLPKSLPEVPGLEIAVHMSTATEVGGDYYDFITSEDGTLNVALADATGHGMKSGTLVTFMKGLFTTNASVQSITEFFNNCNIAIKRLKMDKMMMGMIFLKIKENKIAFSNAGLPSLMVYKKNQEKATEINFNNMPLGALSAVKYTEEKLSLESGDAILLLTDGLPELKNVEGEIFGYERVIELYNKFALEPAEVIIEKIKSAGLDWVSDVGPEDDITLVVIKFI